MVRSCRENVLTMKLAKSMKEYNEMIEEIVGKELIASINYHIVENEECTFGGNIIINILTKGIILEEIQVKLADKGMLLLKGAIISPDRATYDYKVLWG